jgi:hypothetical protein
MRTQKKVVLSQAGLITIDRTKKTVNCWYTILGRNEATYVISVKEQSKVAMLGLLQLALQTPTLEPGLDARAAYPEDPRFNTHFCVCKGTNEWISFPAAKEFASKRGFLDQLDQVWDIENPAVPEILHNTA